MLLLPRESPSSGSSRPTPLPRSNARALYSALIQEGGRAPGQIDELAHAASRAFLLGRLHAARQLESRIPGDLHALPAWLEAEHRTAAAAYRDYLKQRREGGKRRFFCNRSHALHFLRAVAPTKLVDGAWLYGVLDHADDARLAPLVRIYLEELGDGNPAQNHVLLYRRLLARLGIDGWQQLGDEHFTQGAIQLALAHHANEFLPEIIGFNLGYEQLPLHLPITAFELAELGIDAYYFTVHVSVDNASTGHARKSLECLLDCMPRLGDASAFYRRVIDGFKLNDLGMGSTAAIGSFALEPELLSVLGAKAAVGAQLHADRCRIGGKPVSEWLGEAGQLPAFLEALQSSGWIQRGQAAEESRFWRLLTDDRAPMFGVFNGYERQLLRDWIEDGHGAPVARASAPAGAGSGAPPSGTSADLHGEVALLQHRLAQAHGRAETRAVLKGFMSPANHSTPAGLAATRAFAGRFASAA